MRFTSLMLWRFPGNVAGSYPPLITSGVSLISVQKPERPFDMLNFLGSACPACLTPKTSSKTYLNPRSKSISVRPVLGPVDDNGSWTSSTTLEELEAVALPEFDDPNIDKDEAIAGVLGE